MGLHPLPSKNAVILMLIINLVKEPWNSYGNASCYVYCPCNFITLNINTYIISEQIQLEALDGVFLVKKKKNPSAFLLYCLLYSFFLFLSHASETTLFLGCMCKKEFGNLCLWGCLAPESSVSVFRFRGDCLLEHQNTPPGEQCCVTWLGIIP